MITSIATEPGYTIIENAPLAARNTFRVPARAELLIDVHDATVLPDLFRLGALKTGTVGAAPIQNIGAYGVEVREFVETIEAFDRRDGRLVRLCNADCAFTYRDSVFKR